MNSDPESSRTFTRQHSKRAVLALIFLLQGSLTLWAQNPLTYSVATPRPINPAESTTNPSAQATQNQNPSLGSVPAARTAATIRLSMREAIGRGLRYNLGLIESNQASADV